VIRALVAVLLIALPASAASTPDQLLAKARALREAGRAYESGLVIRAAAKRNPSHVALRIAEQNDMINDGQYASALAYFQGAYESDPSGLNAYLFARIDHDRVRARATVARALREGRTHPGLAWLALSRRVADLSAAGKLETALKLVEDCRDCGAEPASVLQTRAELAAQLGRLDQALDLVQDARAVDPQDAGAHATLIGVLTVRGDAEALITAIFNPPHNHRFAYAAAAHAVYEENTGNHARALESWREALEAPLDPYGWHGARAGAHHALGDGAAALEETKAAAALDPDDAGVRLGLAFALAERDRAAAEEAIRREYERNAFSLGALRAMAFVEFSHGRLDESIKFYTRALALAPGLPELWVNRGSVRTHQKDVAGALADFKRAKDLYYWHPGAARETGRTHLEASRYGECMEDFRGLALREAPEPEDLRLYARCCRGAGHGDKAVAAIKRAMDATPGVAEYISLSRELVAAERQQEESGSRYPRDEKVRAVKTRRAAALTGSPPSAYESGGNLLLGVPWGKQTVLLRKTKIGGTQWSPDGKALYYIAENEIRRIDLPSLSTATVWAEAPKDELRKRDGGHQLVWFEVLGRTRELAAIAVRFEGGVGRDSELLVRSMEAGPVRSLHRRRYMERLEAGRAGGRLFVFGGGNLRVEPSSGTIEEFPIIGCTLDMRSSPDGSKVVCVSIDSTEPERGELNLYDVDGRKKIPLEVAGRRPAWSPDGRSIAYVWRDRQLRVLDLATKSVTAYELPYETDLLQQWAGAGDTNTEWSADGRFVHFSAAPIAKPRGEFARRTTVIVDLKENAVWAREGLLPTFEWTPAPGAF
jgi:tetratricopeptide (TPR) repeat protein